MLCPRVPSDLFVEMAKHQANTADTTPEDEDTNGDAFYEVEFVKVPESDVTSELSDLSDDELDGYGKRSFRKANRLASVMLARVNESTNDYFEADLIVYQYTYPALNGETLTRRVDHNLDGKKASAKFGVTIKDGLKLTINLDKESARPINVLLVKPRIDDLHEKTAERSVSPTDVLSAIRLNKAAGEKMVTAILLKDESEVYDEGSVFTVQSKGIIKVRVCIGRPTKPIKLFLDKLDYIVM